jgi:hypothetical protein
VTAGVACGHCRVVDEIRHVGLPVIGQSTGDGALKLIRHGAVRDPVCISVATPVGLVIGAPIDRQSELAKGLFRYVKRRIFRPLEGTLRQADFFDTERLAMGVEGVLLVRTAVTDVRPSDNQRGAVFDCARCSQRSVHGCFVVTVDLLNMPAVGFEARADVLREGQVRRGGQRYAVGIIEIKRPRRNVPARDAASAVTPSIKSPSLARTYVQWFTRAPSPWQFELHRSAIASPTPFANP